MPLNRILYCPQDKCKNIELVELVGTAIAGTYYAVLECPECKERYAFDTYDFTIRKLNENAFPWSKKYLGDAIPKKED